MEITGSFVVVAVDYKARARELIEDMKVARPTCDDCTRVSYAGAEGFLRIAAILEIGHCQPLSPRSVAVLMAQHGFEEELLTATLLRRCASCASTRLYPWAWQLDVERVAHVLEHDARCGVCQPSFLIETLYRNQAGEPIGPHDEVPSPMPAPTPAEDLPTESLRSPGSHRFEFF
jgi:hypothetical protein